MREFKYPLILLVEDNDADFETIKRAFKKSQFSHILHRCTDGDDALAYLFRKEKYADYITTALPALILLDLNLPGIDGREVLNQIKNSLKLQQIPVVILTTSSYEVDIIKCYNTGANGYIVKSIDFQRFEQSLHHLQEYWFSVNELPN